MNDELLVHTESTFKASQGVELYQQWWAPPGESAALWSFAMALPNTVGVTIILPVIWSVAAIRLALLTCATTDIPAIIVFMSILSMIT